MKQDENPDEVHTSTEESTEEEQNPTGSGDTRSLSDRRKFLRVVAAGTGISVAGCSGFARSNGSPTTDPETATESATTTHSKPTTRSEPTMDRSTSARRSRTTQRLAGTPVSTPPATPAETTQTTPTTPAETTKTTTTPDKTANPTDADGAYLSPGADIERYRQLVETRKRAALRTVLGVSEVGEIVTKAVSSTAYHRILKETDFIEILAPHDMTVSPVDEDGNAFKPDPFEIAPSYYVEYDAIRQVRALIDRETGDLSRLDIQQDAPRFDNGTGSSRTYLWDYSRPGYDLRPAQVSLENDRVREILRDKHWYVASTAVLPPYSGFSSEYPIGSLSVAWFNWDDREGDHVALHTIVDIDEGEVLAINPPTQNTPQPLSGIANEVEGETSLDGVLQEPITPPGEMGLSKPWLDDGDHTAAHGTIEQHDWHVEWRNTQHNAYRIAAKYRDKPVFGPSTLVPFMFSDYPPFGTTDPGVPKGEKITYHFWDPLGVTGPGVVERHDFEDGFRVRGTFHSGSSDRWEWRFGQNFGPYRYIVDWSFYDDGRAMLTVRFPTTGCRTTNGYPKYTFHVALEPGFETATASAFDGSSWSPVTTESGFARSKTPKLRVENADGPERVVFEHPGERTLLLQYDPDLVEYEQDPNGTGLERQLHDDKKYLEVENYLRGRAIDDEHLQLRTLSSQDTGEGPYATVDPFMFVFGLRAENY